MKLSGALYLLLVITGMSAATLYVDARGSGADQAVLEGFTITGGNGLGNSGDGLPANRPPRPMSPVASHRSPWLP